MPEAVREGMYICEGTSDTPLARHVEVLFRERGHRVRLNAPDYTLVPSARGRDVKSKIEIGLTLLGAMPDVVVVHRDCDNAGIDARRSEIVDAADALGVPATVCLVPMTMTEAWALLDEEAIRRVAARPNGRTDLQLPKARNVESIADPKKVLQDVLLVASETSGRRRDQASKRFSENRRRLLELIDPHGPVSTLSAWLRLCGDVQAVCDGWDLGLPTRETGVLF